MAESSETDRLRELRDIKRDRLHELDKQAALLGDAQTPPHIQIERAALRKELDIADAVVDRAPRAEFIEELGGSGRFGAYYAELKRANDGVALVGERVEERFEQLDTLVKERFEQLVGKMNIHRQWIILIGIVVVVILVVVAVVVTIVVMRGA